VTSFDLENYRRRAEQFIGELDLEYYQHFSGRKPVCDTAAVYARYPELFTRDAFTRLNELYEEAVDDEKRRLAYLLAFTVDGYMGRETTHLSDEIANTESATQIEVDGQPINLRQAGVVQANEADGARRQRILDARLAATSEHLNPLYDQLWRECHDLALGLGYPDYMELYSEVRGLDYPSLAAELQEFLIRTEGLYARVMDQLASDRLNCSLEELRFADLPYLWRAPDYDHVFRADRLLPALRSTLGGFGIDLEAQHNVHLDTEVREGKTPRAFCSPVRIPEEIYLVVLPQGGQDDFASLLHEAGHTEHFAHVRPGLSFEYRHLGDNAVTEAFAFLFDHLLLNRRWLDVTLGFADADEFLHFANVNDLYFIRRYVGKLLYEIKLHTQTGALGEMPGEYSRCLSGALLLDVPPENYLADVDDGFYCASYLRAWLFEAALRMMLQDRYGMEWFRQPEAAAWVKELWSSGQHFPAERMLLKHGGGRLDADPLRHHIERALGR
jgi:hypothetical protein